MGKSGRSSSSLWLLAMAPLLLLSTVAHAGVIHTEDFNDGVADGWNLNAAPGTSSTSLVADPVNGTTALAINTGFFYQIAETASFDLTGATFVSITFDYADTDGGSTRFITVDFWDGSAWIQLADLRHSAQANATGLTFTVSTGFSTDNRFRFEGKNMGSGSLHTTFIDNVVIQSDVSPVSESATLANASAVPEPATLGLLGAGLLGLGLIRRKRAA